MIDVIQVQPVSVVCSAPELIMLMVKYESEQSQRSKNDTVSDLSGTYVLTTSLYINLCFMIHY